MTTKQKVMLRIIQKCGTLDNIAQHIENYAKEFGEESREFFIQTFWDTIHIMSANQHACRA